MTDELRAVAQMLDAIAWPVVVLIGLYMFRAPIAERLASLRSLKGRNWEARFERETAELEEAAKIELPATNVLPGQSPSPEVSHAWALADRAPRLAVLEAWLGVERELVRLAESLGLQRTELLRAVHELSRVGRIGQGFARLVADLRRLRNEAAHALEFELSGEAARNYVATAEMVTAALAAVQ